MCSFLSLTRDLVVSGLASCWQSLIFLVVFLPSFPVWVHTAGTVLGQGENRPCPSQVPLMAWLALTVTGSPAQQTCGQTDLCCAHFVVFPSGLLLVSQGCCKVYGNATHLLPDFSAPGECGLCCPRVLL